MWHSGSRRRPTTERSSSTRVVRVLAALLVAGMASACAHKGGAGGRGGRAGRASPPPAPVPTTAARSTTVRPTVALAGIVAPLQNVAITASLSEPTKAVYVNEGDTVRAGQTLAIQDVADLEANLNAQISLAQSDDARVVQTQYTANLSYGQNPDQVRQARAALRQAQQTLGQGNSDLERDRQLVSSGYISQQQYVQQATTVANDRQAVRSAEAQLSSAITNLNVNGTPQQGLQAANVASAVSQAASARSQADQIRTQIARATIVSPVDGVIVNRNINPGEYPGGRTAFTIQEIAQVYATLNASSADVFAIRNGAPVSLTAGDDRTGRTYAGHIVAVLGQVQPGSTNFTVKALVDNPGQRLKAGVPVTATIDLAPVRGIGIPTTAFLDDSHSTVIVNRNGKAAVARVREVGTDGHTSIVSGLTAGQTVVADGQLGITSGQKLSER